MKQEFISSGDCERKKDLKAFLAKAENFYNDGYHAFRKKRLDYLQIVLGMFLRNIAAIIHGKTLSATLDSLEEMLRQSSTHELFNTLEKKPTPGKAQSAQRPFGLHRMRKSLVYFCTGGFAAACAS